MPENILQAVCVSRATGPVDDALLASIRTSAQRYNRDHDITGVLLGGGGMFIQLLEGPPSEVLRLIESRIATDPRHADLRIIHACFRTERSAPTWNMGIIPISDQPPVELREIVGSLLDAYGSWSDDTAGDRLLRGVHRVIEQNRTLEPPAVDCNQPERGACQDRGVA